MMRICSAIDLGLLPPWTRRFSSSTTRASSLPIVSFRPETVSSVIGAIVTEERRMASRERESRRGCEGGREQSMETEEWRINGEMEENETWRPRFGAHGFDCAASMTEQAQNSRFRVSTCNWGIQLFPLLISVTSIIFPTSQSQFLYQEEGLFNKLSGPNQERAYLIHQPQWRSCGAL